MTLSPFLSRVASARPGAFVTFYHKHRTADSAHAQLMADPFAGLRAMLDLPAFAYKLCIAALITAVARKYLQHGGAFPGGRKRMLGFFDAKDAFDGEFDDDVEDAKDIAREHTELLEAAPKFIVCL